MGWMAKARWCLGIGLALVAAGATHALPILFTVDTSGFAAGTPAILSFEFTDNGPPDNTATITNFTTEGKLDVASTFSDGDVTGVLPDDLVLGPGFATYQQNIALGNFISFIFDTQGNPPAETSFPDGFVFTLLDAEGVPLSFEDETGALLIYSIGADIPLTFISSIVEPTEAPTGVPEPHALALLSVGLLLLAVVRAFKHQSM